MNIFNNLCNALDLGKLLTEPTAVSGGLLHKMWHVRTELGEYAVKELNSRVILKKNAISYYELTEKIAAQFYYHGIPTIKCITHNDRSVIKINDLFFIVYPWVKGKVLPNNQIDGEKAKIIGSIFAKIHTLKLDFKEFRDHQFIDLLANIHSREYLQTLYALALNHTVDLKIDTKYLCDWYEKYANTILDLKNDMVISHGDLDQKNVLWKSDNSPVIIDWEGSRYMNPTQEIVGIALDWSGAQLCNVNFDLLASILDSYRESSGTIKKEIVEQSLWVFIGNWLNWLNFNIERIVENYPIEEQLLAKKEIKRTLKIIYYLVDQIEKLHNTILSAISNR